MTGLLARVVAWLREGYPAGVPERDYIALLALLRRRLSDEEVLGIAQQLGEAGMLPPERVDIALEISKLTNELPSNEDVERVRDHLAFRGFPGEANPTL